jgi:two-component system sensor histidine kinase KdpD
MLQLYGRSLSADDQRVLRAIADQVVVALERRHLTKDAADAAALADIDVVRTALLRAVSHDLRTPLASIKAMISGLRDSSVAWTPDQMAEALATVDEESDRLNRLVGNLLDASRLQIGALAVDIYPTSVADTVSTALHSIAAAPGAVAVEIVETMPLVMADPALFERSLANVVSNAMRFCPPGEVVRITAGVVGDTVHLRVIDRGPGILPVDRAKVIAPFQRLGDQHTSDGVGLGLSIAQGFVQAMGGSLSLDDTPGGGLTVTIALPRAAEPAPAGAPTPVGAIENPVMERNR